jgi:4-hydroxy-tetrahydrodipicolinate synthase
MHLAQNYSGFKSNFRRYLFRDRFEMYLPLKGIIPPMVTPLQENGELDLDGLKNLVEHMLGGGVHGLFLLGTTGEGTSLSHRLRKQMVTETSSMVEKRVPLLVCITDTSIEESLELAHHAKQAGADFLVAASPFYLPISQIEMQDYLEVLLPELPLPFLIYNMPSCTKLNLSLKTIKKAKELGAVGIKDSSGDMEYLNSLIREFRGDPKFSIITGSELYLHKTILNGGHGAVTGGANFFPSLFVDLYEASLVRDMDKIMLLREKVIQIDNTIYSVGQNISKYIKGTKSALSALGICNDYTAPPIKRFEKFERAKIQGYMDEFFSTNEFSTAK